MTSRQQRPMGFTLIEIVIVIAIIAVLTAVLVPLTGTVLHKAKVSSGNRQVRAIRLALTHFLNKFETYPACDGGDPQRLGSCHSVYVNDFLNREDVLLPWLKLRISNDPFGNAWGLHWHPNSDERHWLTSAGPNRLDDTWRCWPNDSCGGDDFVQWLGRGKEY